MLARAAVSAAAVGALTQGRYPPAGFVPGPLGWLVEGGVDCAVHLCALIARFLLLPGRRGHLSRVRRADPPAGQGPTAR